MHHVVGKAGLLEVGDRVRDVVPPLNGDLSAGAELLDVTGVGMHDVRMRVVELLLEGHQLVLLPVDLAKLTARLVLALEAVTTASVAAAAATSKTIARSAESIATPAKTASTAVATTTATTSSASVTSAATAKAGSPSIVVSRHDVPRLSF